MPGPASNSPNPQAEQAHLQRLAAELTKRGYDAKLHTPVGRPAYLDVCNPAATILSEQVYAQADSYWWPWAERIGSTHDPVAAAATLARVLRTADGQ